MAKVDTKKKVQKKVENKPEGMKGAALEMGGLAGGAGRAAAAAGKLENKAIQKAMAKLIRKGGEAFEESTSRILKRARETGERAKEAIETGKNVYPKGRGRVPRTPKPQRKLTDQEARMLKRPPTARERKLTEEFFKKHILHPDQPPKKPKLPKKKKEG